MANFDKCIGLHAGCGFVLLPISYAAMSCMALQNPSYGTGAECLSTGSWDQNTSR